MPVRGDDGLCIACARGEAGEAVGRIGSADRGRRPFRGLHRRRRNRKEDLARRVREGRRLVSHRRPDEARRGTAIFHFVDRSRRHFPLEGRECRDHRSQRGGHGMPRRRSTPPAMASAIPGCDGRAGMVAMVAGNGFDLAEVQGPSVAPPAGLCLPRDGAVLQCPGYDRNLQAEEAGTCARGFRSAAASPTRCSSRTRSPAPTGRSMRMPMRGSSTARSGCRPAARFGEISGIPASTAFTNDAKDRPMTGFLHGFALSWPLPIRSESENDPCR